MRRWHVLIDLIRTHKLKTGAEIGVNQGVNLRAVLEGCRGFHWIAVDDWRPGYLGWDESKRRFSRNRFDRVHRRFADRITLIEADSATAAEQVSRGTLDLVFIDADHEYEGVKRDIALWAPKVRTGGIIAGHDYDQPDFPGVRQAVDEFCRPNLGAEWVWWTRS